ncbi:unnamed protein product [Amoebophrya sp. A120]|nr:unnamed protein product [Amoebophrya sp. A120]|eukprot:GSA120T00024013001.1
MAALELDADTLPTPADFLCPILHDIMEDPVCTVDGQSYSRSAIAEWFRMGHGTSPVTGAQLPSLALTPNIALRKAIATYLDERPEIVQRKLEEVGLIEAVKLFEAEQASREEKNSKRVRELESENLALRAQLNAVRNIVNGGGSTGSAHPGGCSANIFSSRGCNQITHASGGRTAAKNEFDFVVPNIALYRAGDYMWSESFYSEDPPHRYRHRATVSYYEYGVPKSYVKVFSECLTLPTRNPKKCTVILLKRKRGNEVEGSTKAECDGYYEKNRYRHFYGKTVDIESWERTHAESFHFCQLHWFDSYLPPEWINNELEKTIRIRVSF